MFLKIRHQATDSIVYSANCDSFILEETISFCNVHDSSLQLQLATMTTHIFLAVKMGVAICKFYWSSFQSHPRPAIFSCTKQFVLLLDIENWCVLYYFYVLS